MNKKIKKIIAATLITTASAAMIGCGTPNNKLAKNIDKGMAEFVNSINNLDYVETSENKIGKIIETASAANALDDNYLTQTLEEIGSDDAITLPSERNDNFKLFVLSNEPFISFTSDDNSANLNIQLNFSTTKITDTSNEINTKINNLILKRSILMIYVNEIYNNRVNLTEENRIAINAYVNVIKENASYLSGNRGMVRNQLTLAGDLVNNNENSNLINYYMIKSGEALETRSSKIDSTLSAIDSIIQIIENNLDPSSIYYNTSLSSSYEDIIQNLKTTNSEIQNTSTENRQIADDICLSLNLCEDCNYQTESQAKQKTSQDSTNKTNRNQINDSKTRKQSKSQINNNLEKNNIVSKQTNKQLQNNPQLRKNANFTKNNEISALNTPNNNIFTKNNTIENKQKTLDIQRNNFKNKNLNQEENNQITEEFQNEHKTNHNKNANHTRQRPTNINSRRSNQPTQNTHENIKRVPYIRTLD